MTNAPSIPLSAAAMAVASFQSPSTNSTLWAGVQVVPRLPKSAITKRSSRSSASKQ
jgi:hypothetical protein